MQIDILSDIHVDFHIRSYPTLDTVKKVFEPIITNDGKRVPSDILIIAGDIGHNNKENIQVLKYLKELFRYKHIVCVLGNHDYYLIDRSTRVEFEYDSFKRVKDFRNMINAEEGMHCLDGEIITIEGIRIGGCDSWYDGEYIKKHFSKDIKDSNIHQLWNQTMNDSNYIDGMEWQVFSKMEKSKIATLYQKVDVMITHVNPSIKKEHINSQYREDKTTGFFSFDEERYLKDGTMKYWIYGHTHDAMEYEIHGVQCVCNPMGYPSEGNSIIKHIDI